LSESAHSISISRRERRLYCAARNELLEAEIELRRNIEAVAAKRRQLPSGGRVEQDYLFDQSTGNSIKQIRLSELLPPERIR